LRIHETAVACSWRHKTSWIQLGIYAHILPRNGIGKKLIINKREPDLKNPQPGLTLVPLSGRSSTTTPAGLFGL
jgi:hypothetical protein